MDVNPWKVDSIQAFYLIKCPECTFDTKTETIFQEHAFENHPLSHVLFHKKLENNADISDTIDINEKSLKLKEKFDSPTYNCDPKNKTEPNGKDLLETKSTKVYSKMLLMKSSENNFIFSPVSYLIMWVYESPKEFWKNSHFENMRADFLRR